NLIYCLFFDKVYNMFQCLNKKKIKDKAYRIVTEKKNKANLKKFVSVPYSGRVVFVPQCMRNIKNCKAKEVGGYYICAECGSCKISAISKKSRELGYKALYILKGGRIVEKLVDELDAKAILGVACFYEGTEGMKLCEKKKIPVQFVPLAKDGCVDTDVDVEQVIKALETK
ncbi:MAG: DUF116 domain-containing protein, partial [Endomicrobiales bacterium]|nr:DUF116 domain-containing protein [Endomicrobiales bacterium]